MAASHAIMLELGAKQEDFEIRIGSRVFLDSLVKELGLLSDERKKGFWASRPSRKDVSTPSLSGSEIGVWA
jgi:hypothetical protein